jgi:hypothetical protein
LKAGLAGLAVLVAAGIGVYLHRFPPGEQETQPQGPTTTSEAAVQPASPVTSAPPPPAASVTSAATPSAPPAPAPAAPAPPPTLAAVTALLAQVPCSALAASVSDRAVRVHGFVPQRDGMMRVKEGLGTLPGIGALNLDLQQIGDDKCEVIKEYSPYWAANWQSGHIATLRTHAGNGLLTEGDKLVDDLTTPGYDSYVNIDYYVLDGSVVHMVPGPRLKDNQALPHYSATVGSAGDWIISKPFGSELVVLLITPVPLFDHMRPEIEPRGDYLHALDARLKQIAAKYGHERLVADIVQITSKPRSGQ